MRLFANPIIREGIQVYFHETQGLAVYGVYLIILALLQCLVIILPAGDPRVWLGPAYLFKLTAVGVLLSSAYFIMRLANQEIATRKFQSLTHWFKYQRLTVANVAVGQIFLMCIHISILLLLALPLLGWAGAIEHTPLPSILGTLALLFLYAFIYGSWGLFAVAFWDHSQDSRRVFVRCLLVCLLLVSGLLYLALNPVAFLLRHLEGLEFLPLELGEWRLEGTTVHMIYHAVLLLSGIGLYGWALRRTKETYT